MNQGFLYAIFWIVSKIRIKKIHQYWISQENGSPSELMRELTPKCWIRSITLPVDIMFPTIRDYLNMWILSLGHLKEEIACFFKACQCCQDKIFFCTRGLIFPEEGLPLRFNLLHVLNLFSAVLHLSRWHLNFVQTVLFS